MSRRGLTLIEVMVLFVVAGIVATTIVSTVGERRAKKRGVQDDQPVIESKAVEASILDAVGDGRVTLISADGFAHQGPERGRMWAYVLKDNTSSYEYLVVERFNMIAVCPLVQESSGEGLVRCHDVGSVRFFPTVDGRVGCHPACQIDAFEAAAQQPQPKDA